tara:strand:+ start:484 stop:1068 length:585 start_codon:yes stop_codon:yes gene_type:complete
MAIATFIMFTTWALVRSYMNRPPGDYETEVCDIRLKDKLYDQALEAASKALNKSPFHRGAMMCKALVYISLKDYKKATKELNELINFLENNLEIDDKTGTGTLAAAYANRGIIKDRQENYEGALKDYVEALKIDSESVDGPGIGTVILNYKFKSSSVRKRAQYIYEQLQLPKEERVLKIKELDEGQVMHKPGKL